nr:5051_t:CDS:2 [Entrophospora candida]
MAFLKTNKQQEKMPNRQNILNITEIIFSSIISNFDSFEQNNRIFIAIIKALISLKNQPSGSREITNQILKYGITKLWQSLYSTSSSSIPLSSNDATTITTTSTTKITADNIDTISTTANNSKKNINKINDEITIKNNYRMSNDLKLEFKTSKKRGLVLDDAEEYMKHVSVGCKHVRYTTTNSSIHYNLRLTPRSPLKSNIKLDKINEILVYSIWVNAGPTDVRLVRRLDNDCLVKYSILQAGGLQPTSEDYKWISLSEARTLATELNLSQELDSFLNPRLFDYFDADIDDFISKKINETKGYSDVSENSCHYESPFVDPRKFHK